MRPLLLSLVLLGCHNAPTTPQPTAAIARATSVDVTTAEAATRAGALLIDVRTPEEYAEGHAAHAINIPLDTLDQNAALVEPHKAEPIYLICQSGHRSGIATDQLLAQGYQAVNVEGGTVAWRSAQLPME